MIVIVIIIVALIALWRIGTALNRMAPQADSPPKQNGSMFGVIVACLAVFIGSMVVISEIVDTAKDKPTPQFKTAAGQVEAQKLEERRHQP